MPRHLGAGGGGGGAGMRHLRGNAFSKSRKSNSSRAALRVVTFVSGSNALRPQQPKALQPRTSAAPAGLPWCGTADLLLVANINSNGPNSLGREVEGQAAVLKVAPVSRAPLHATLTSRRRARHALEGTGLAGCGQQLLLFTEGRSQALPHPPQHKEGSVLLALEQPWENRLLLCLCIPATQHGCKRGAQPSSSRCEEGLFPRGAWPKQRC